MVTQVDCRRCSPETVTPSPSSNKLPQSDLEGQSALFDTNSGQAAVVQDVYGLLIEYLDRRRGCFALWPWKKQKKPEDVVQYVPYSEILSARYLPIRRYCSGLPGHLRQQHFLEVQVVQRHKCRPWQWTLQQLVLSTESRELAKQWVQQIKQRLQELPQRPKQLLVFVNPFGGKRRARDVWQKVSAPALTAAGVQCQVIETVRQSHAEAVIRDLSLQQLQQLDGILAVGGDGMFSELLTGVLQHRHLDAALQLRLAHIPAGSTDAVACTLHGTRDPLTATLHVALGDCTPLDVARLVTLPPLVSGSATSSATASASGAAESPRVSAVAGASAFGGCGISTGSETMLLEPLGPDGNTSAASNGSCMQAGLGCRPKSSRHEKRHKQQRKQQLQHHEQQQQPVHQPQMRHFVCVANYGFLGDVMTTSERLRWMGPIRYDVAGALRWLLLRGYKATIWYKPAKQPEQQQQQDFPVPLVSPSAVSPVLHHPRPALHAGAPAYHHQHSEQQQQHQHQQHGSSCGPGSSSGSGGSCCSFEIHEPVPFDSSKPSADPSPQLCEEVDPQADHQAPSGNTGSSQGHISVTIPQSVTSDASHGSLLTPDGGLQSSRYHAGGKHVSFNHVVYAGSVSSIASNPSAAGLATRASSVTSIGSMCHSRCLLCGAAAMQRENSRSLFVAEQQEGQLAASLHQLQPLVVAPVDCPADHAACAADHQAALETAVAASLLGHAAQQKVPAGTAQCPPGTLANAPVAAPLPAAPPAAAVAAAAEAPGPEWVKLEGNYASIMCVVTSCRSDKSKLGLMPEAHLSDGRLALVLVEKRSRLQYLKFLVQLASKGIMPDMLPFVRVEYVTDVQVQTKGRQSVWNVDGELLKHSRVSFGVHAGLVDVFARGIEIM